MDSELTHHNSEPKPQVAGRLRVLLIAELANPEWVSVPLLGWSQYLALSRRVDAHLVTHVRNQENILKAGVEPARFTALDTTRVERPLDMLAQRLRGNGGGLTTLTAFSALPYYEFEQQLWKRFGESIRARHWDVVHRLTPLTPTIPSLLARKCARAGVPFILGPLNGGVPWPKGFAKARVNEREWLTYVREAYKLMPGYHSTRAHASAIITGSSDTRQQIARRYQEKTVYIPENAVEPSRFTRCVSGAVTLPIKVAFVGRFTLYKGADMLIEAAAPLVRAGQVELDLIGGGPQEEALRALAQKLQLPPTIFAGWIKHEHLQDRLCRSDVFAFPSVREFGGAVVLEAMAVGLVPIVMAYGGPGELVSPQTGFALPMGTRAQIITVLRDRLERMVLDPSLLRTVGKRARARVLRSFTWDAKAAQVCEVYRWAMGQRSKPDFGMPIPD